jgi:uncharacterized protein (TIRG00374 family)
MSLGPQVGGEPLQALSLQKKYGIPLPSAAASVLLDKLLEFLVNFWMLALGLTAILQVGILGVGRVPLTASMLLLAALILIPPLHLIMLSQRHYPMATFLGRLPYIPKKARLVRLLRAAEWLAGRFCQRHPRALLAALGVSLLAGAGMLVDYALMLAFLGVHLPFWSSVAGWTAGWLAFLMPLPGGLGALESSQVAALGIFGIPAALALSVVLLMRARDLLVASLGLVLAKQGLSPVKQKTNPTWPYRPARKEIL